MEFNVSFISGISLGIDFPPPVEEDIRWNVILDLFILRFVFIKYVDE